MKPTVTMSAQQFPTGGAPAYNQPGMATMPGMPMGGQFYNTVQVLPMIFASRLAASGAG